MKMLLLVLPLAVVLLQGLEANTSPIIGVRTLVLGDVPEMPERYLRTEEGYELVEFSKRQPSKLIHAYRSEGLTLFAKSSAGGKDIYRAVDQAGLPAGAKSILLLCWDHDAELKYLAIDDNILEAKYDNWLMINTTGKAIGFRIGEDEKPFFIKPNSIQNCRIASQQGVGVGVEGRAEWDGEVKKFYSTYWPVREGQRSIVIFYQRGNSVKIKKISDHLLKEEPTS
ncbi:MAG TPA: hypothetical protein VJ952_10480 [Opitutales bacterium]|nr:hypothetical protein [Opitutales bacterium]